MKIIYKIAILMLLLLSFGCAKISLVDDTPTPIDENDQIRVAKVAEKFEKMQYVAVNLTDDDLLYAIKYFDHFVAFCELAKINTVVLNMHSVKQFDINSKANQNLIEFVNLLDYKAINVIYKLKFEDFIKNYKFDMKKKERAAFIDDLEDDIELINDFFASLDNTSKVNSFLIEIDLPTIIDHQAKVKKNSLLSIYYNNGFGSDKENETAYNQATEKILFFREIFPLERIIWNVNEYETPKGLTAKILDRRLGIYLLDYIDMIFLVSSSKAISTKSHNQAQSTIVKNAIIPSLYLADNSIENWQSLEAIIIDITEKNQALASFGGLYILDYGSFYKLLRPRAKYINNLE